MVKDTRILKVNSSENLYEFIKRVESDNSDKISDMIRNDIDIFFDIDSTLRKLKRFCKDDEVNDDIDSVRCLVLQLHQKLLFLDHQNYHHRKLIDELFSDTRLVYHVVNENKELIV